MFTAAVGVAVRQANVKTKDWTCCVITDVMLPCRMQTNKT